MTIHVTSGEKSADRALWHLLLGGTFRHYVEHDVISRVVNDKVFGSATSFFEGYRAGRKIKYQVQAADPATGGHLDSVNAEHPPALSATLPYQGERFITRMEIHRCLRQFSSIIVNEWQKSTEAV